MSVRLLLLSVKGYVATLAVLLLGLSLWMGGNALLHLYGEADREITSMDSPRALIVASMLESFDDWFGDPQARIRAGLLHFRLSLPGGSGFSPDAVALQRSIADLRDGLARAPADARAWTALAQAELSAGDLSKGKRAFRMALLTALFDPSLTLRRCQLGLALWTVLDREERELVASQLREAWSRQPDALLGLAKFARNADVIFAALEKDEGQRAAFEKALNRR